MLRKFNKTICFVIAVLLLFAGCDSRTGDSAPGKYTSRSFYMGFTPFPYASTPEATNYTYKMIGENADSILFHLDEGIPWNEMYEKKKFNSKAERELTSKLSSVLEKLKVVMAVTPLDGERKGIAGYWGENGTEPLSGNFKGKTFDDPVVIQTYIDYCREVIKKMNPAYFIYGIEVNLLGKNNPKEWQAFTELCKQTYSSLKKEFPELPVMFSIQLRDFYENEDNDRKNLAKIIPYTDYIAVSCYPFAFSGDSPPNTIPDDYFSKIRSLAPQKPFAIAETGYMAENLKIKSSNISLKSNEEYQNQYVEILLNAAQEQNAEFVFWFVPRDYDALWAMLEKQGVPEWFKFWKDTGLEAGDGTPRKGLATWKIWLELPRGD